MESNHTPEQLDELQEQQFWAAADLAFIERYEADSYDVGCEFDN